MLIPYAWQIEFANRKGKDTIKGHTEGNPVFYKQLLEMSLIRTTHRLHRQCNLTHLPTYSVKNLTTTFYTTYLAFLFHEKKFMYLRGRVTGRDKKRSSIHWFISQTVTTAMPGQSQIQEPTTPPWSPAWVAGARALGPASAAFPGTYTGSWMHEKPGLELTQWRGCSAYKRLQLLCHNTNRAFFL